MIWTLVIILWTGSTTGHVAIDKIDGLDHIACVEAAKVLNHDSVVHAYCVWHK